MENRRGLPEGIAIFERGWLSANNVLFHGEGLTALVDSGYATHAPQTVALVRHALQGRPLDLLLNTHLHSDHCGGNAALQSQYPSLTTLIPPGLARHVRQWDPVALTYEPTGQQCPRFRMDGLLVPGSEVELGARKWQIHGAPGHDPHSIMLFEPEEQLLISADALWANGFGVIFQELEGEQAFHEVHTTLDLIEALDPRLVIPGHGDLFTDVAAALETARRRLATFVEDPAKHSAHAAKVLLKFKLLEVQRLRRANLLQWAAATPYIQLVHRRWFAASDIHAWLEQLVESLARSGAARCEDDWVLNT